MKMKEQIKFYLFYAAIFLISGSISAGLHFAYEANVFPNEVFSPSAEFDIVNFCSTISFFAFPLTVMFLCAFTVYACFVSGFCCMYVGAVLGRVLIKYCLSEHNPYTHAAILMLFAVFASLFVVISKSSGVIRSKMRYVATDPKILIKNQDTVSFFKSFITSICVVLFSSAALYMMLIYFPI